MNERISQLRQESLNAAPQLCIERARLVTEAYEKYAGTVEDIHKGTVFVRLELGVNAIAHSCYDSRTVGKKDKVSFVVTHIDEERNVAVGIITRIIKQNL